MIGAQFKNMAIKLTTYNDMINKIVHKITCFIIFFHCAHSPSLIDTIILKHHSNSITNITIGNISITLFIKLFTKTIGSSHWNQFISIRGKSIHDEAVSEPYQLL